MAGRPALGDSWSYRLEAKAKKLLKARLLEAGGLAKKGSSGMSDREREALVGFLSRYGMASKEEVLRALPNVRSQTGQRDEILAAMRRSRDLLPHIEATLKRYDMPTALGRIPFVESSFNARAYSKVGAVGIWQFMPATARQFISKDRKLWVDPLRQTVAAAKMLRIFRSQLPDWSTTVTAYNSGAGRLSRLVRKFRTDSLEGILAVKGDNGLGFAGENFYAQFVSANLVEAYRRQVFHKYLEGADMAVGRSRLPFDRLRCE
jgi:membrane-bound lytic murein transglycosylase D